MSKYRITIRLGNKKPNCCKDCKVCHEFIDSMSEDENPAGECRIIYKDNWDYDKKVLSNCPINKDSEGNYYIRYNSDYNKCRGCKLCNWSGYLEDNNITAVCMLTGNQISLSKDDVFKIDNFKDKDCPLLIEEIK